MNEYIEIRHHQSNLGFSIGRVFIECLLRENLIGIIR